MRRMAFAREASSWTSSRSVVAQCFNLQTKQRCHSSSSSSSLGSVLVLSNLYPQPSASAAGVRTNHILQQLCRDPDWTFIHYGTGAAPLDKNDHKNNAVENLINKGVSFHSIPPNRSSKMKQLLDSIQDLSLVIFDRYHTEEAYSFHICNHSPHAIRVVDMQDMHSLRQGRKSVVEQSRDESSWDCITKATQYIPSNQDTMLLRELASIHRSDLTLVCSSHEYKLLTDVYQIPSTKLCMAPFWVSSKPQTTTRQQTLFEKRRDFCFLGGFRHGPNVDAVQQLQKYVWPRIRQRLPEARLQIYGAYCPPPIQQLHNVSSGFLVHGYADNLEAALSDKRVMLAPLRYGAGIKGKIVDAWKFGLPVVTTSIGSEGIMPPGNDNNHNWGGIVSNKIGEFVEEAIRLYTDSESWKKAVMNGNAILSNQFDESQFDTVSQAWKDAARNRESRRRDDYFGPLLWHQTARSTEYFSRWIECKESKKR